MSDNSMPDAPQPDHTADEQMPEPVPLLPRLPDDLVNPPPPPPPPPPDTPELVAPPASPDGLLAWLKQELSAEAHKVAASLIADHPALLAHLEQHLPPASLAHAQKALGADL